MFTLKQIAFEVQGAIVGDSSTTITSVDDIEEAEQARYPLLSCLSIKRLLNLRMRPLLLSQIKKT